MISARAEIIRCLVFRFWCLVKDSASLAYYRKIINRVSWHPVFLLDKAYFKLFAKHQTLLFRQSLIWAISFNIPCPAFIRFVINRIL